MYTSFFPRSSFRFQKGFEQSVSEFCTKNLLHIKYFCSNVVSLFKISKTNHKGLVSNLFFLTFLSDWALNADLSFSLTQPHEGSKFRARFFLNNLHFFVVVNFQMTNLISLRTFNLINLLMKNERCKYFHKIFLLPPKI